MRLLATAAVLSTLALAATGCQDKKTAAANKQLWNENRSLQTQIQEVNSQLAVTDANFAAAQAELAARDAKISELQSSLVKPEAGSDPAIAGIETSYDAKTKTLTVNLPGDVLFAPGQSTLKKTAFPTLDKIVAALKADYSDKKVKVKGHTDTDPVLKTAKVYKDNLELSLERAATVTRYLSTKGVDPKLVETAGFGANFPKDDKNKSANRRVEIAVILE